MQQCEPELLAMDLANVICTNHGLLLAPSIILRRTRRFGDINQSCLLTLFRPTLSSSWPHRKALSVATLNAHPRTSFERYRNALQMKERSVCHLYFHILQFLLMNAPSLASYTGFLIDLTWLPYLVTPDVSRPPKIRCPAAFTIGRRRSQRLKAATASYNA
jgi:hypothetical protein